MNDVDLALQNTQDNTALYLAAASNNVDIAQVMVDKNKDLPLVQRRDGATPLYVATLLGYQDMASYLIQVTDTTKLTLVQLFQLLITAINSHLYGVALKILDKFPNLALHKSEDGKIALQFLARKPLKSRSVVRRWSWRIWPCIKVNEESTNDEAVQLVNKLWATLMTTMNYRQMLSQLGSYAPVQLLLDAAEVGNVEFIATVISSYPDLIWKVNEEDKSIFHIAVAMRQVEVFNLIYEIGAVKDLIAMHTDRNGNNLLHLVASSPPPGSLDQISGAALQMQRELIWYKEVERVVPPQFREAKNSANETPRSLFATTHENLRKEGEKWMKATGNSCSVVAALITTVGFTAAFTVPGGNDQNNGIPIFQRNPVFVAFAIADAMTLFTSSIAILMFLGILTSRYALNDFLTTLPRRLLLGLLTLFLSITFMMVSFTLTFFIIFKAPSIRWISIPIVVAALTAIPIVLFGYGQFPLLVDIFRSTYRAKYLFRLKTPRAFRVPKKNNTFLNRFCPKCLRKSN